VDQAVRRGGRIKAFYGTSENAVKTQLWIAISVYLLVAIVKKTPRSSRLTLHVATDSLSYYVRENAHFTGTSAERLHKSTTN
jgi:hypothetical protein